MTQNPETFPEDGIPVEETGQTPELKPLISDVTYDRLKKLVQFILPAAGTLYFTLAQIWGLPNGEQVVGTITAFALFGGVALGLSKRAYNNSDAKYDGELVVEPQEGGPVLYTLDVTSSPENWPAKNEIVLKVKNTE